MADLKLDNAVLIIDDSWFARNTLSKQLKEMGFNQFLEAGDADQALTLLNDGKVGIILCDQQMPGMSGIQLLRKLRQGHDLGDAIFILVTAHGDKDLADECAELGAAGVLNKPFSSAELQDMVEQAFQTRLQAQV